MPKPVRPLGPPRPLRAPSESALPPARSVTPRQSAAAAEAEMYDQMRAAGPVEMCREIKRVPAMPDPEELKNRKPTVADLRDNRRRALPDKATQGSSPLAEISAATAPASRADTPAKPATTQQINPNATLSKQLDRPKAALTQVVRPSRMETVTNPTQPALPKPMNVVVPANDAGLKIHRAYKDVRPSEGMKSPQPLNGPRWKKVFAGIGRQRRIRNNARAKAGSRLALVGGFAAAATGVAAVLFRNKREEELLESLLSVDQKSVRDLLGKQDHIRASLIAKGKAVYISVSFEINETESFISDQSSMPGVRLIEAKYTSEPPAEANDETTKWMGLYQERQTTLTRGFIAHEAQSPKAPQTTEPGPWDLRERLGRPGPLTLQSATPEKY